MEDVIQTYLLPYDPMYPVVCFDEACKQLFGEVRPAQRPRPGSPARVDYEYERKGVCHQLLMCEPLRGWRHVRVSERRTRRDYAGCVRDLVDVHYPRAKKIRLVQDNLNTHDGASLYEAFPPPQARRLLDKIEFHYIPKHGSRGEHGRDRDQHHERAVLGSAPGQPGGDRGRSRGLGEQAE